MTDLANQNHKRRDFGIDLVRLLSFIAITYHHYTWVMWYTIDYEAPKHFWPWRIFEVYSRSISYSGHTILFLSLFMIGRAETKPRKTLAVIALVLVGWVVFSAFEYDPNHPFLLWDIYPLLALGLGTSMLVRQLGRRSVSKVMLWLGAYGFALTWIKFWEWPSLQALPLYWRHWVIGDCRYDLADWPILPWVGLAWMAYGLGAYAYAYEYKKKNPEPWLNRWKKQETFIWPVLLLVGAYNYGAFYDIKVGPLFGCFSFRQEPFIFWSHFVFPVFFLRLSLLDLVQNQLKKYSWVHKISKLKFSTHFGIFYLLHYAVIEATKFFHFQSHGTGAVLSFIVFLAILPVTELITWTLLKLVARLRRNHI